MSKFFTIPSLLGQNEARKLSDDIYIKTGCFPFFYPRSNIILYSPKSTENPFYVIVCGLYDLYHDYGRRSLDWFIYRSNDTLREKLISHKNAVEAFRAYIAHGTRSPIAKNKYINTGLFNSLRNKDIDEWSTNEWRDVCAKLTEDSNNLFNYLSKWSDNSQATLNCFMENTYNNLLHQQLIDHLIESVESSHGKEFIEKEDLKVYNQKLYGPSIQPNMIKRCKEKASDHSKSKGTKDLYDLLVKECEKVIYPDSTSKLFNSLQQIV